MSWLACWAQRHSNFAQPAKQRAPDGAIVSEAILSPKWIVSEYGTIRDVCVSCIFRLAKWKLTMLINKLHCPSNDTLMPKHWSLPNHVLGWLGREFRIVKTEWGRRTSRSQYQVSAPKWWKSSESSQSFQIMAFLASISTTVIALRREPNISIHGTTYFVLQEADAFNSVMPTVQYYCQTEFRHMYWLPKPFSFLLPTRGIQRNSWSWFPCWECDGFHVIQGTLQR